MQRAGRSASRTPTSRSCRTRPTSPRRAPERARADRRAEPRRRFFNSGAEAVENAVKIAARRDRPPGRDLLRARLPRPHADGDVADEQDAPVQGGLRAVRARGLPRAVPLPVPLAGGDGRRARSTTLRAMFMTHVAAGNGRGDHRRARPGRGRLRRAPAGFLQGLREICDEHGIVLIVDEVQTGFGRTGTLLAIEHFGVEPDLILLAKSIAAGVPLSAWSARPRSWTRPATRRSAAPTSATRSRCEAALAVLDEIDGRGLLGARPRDRRAAAGALRRAAAATPAIGDVRGLGPDARASSSYATRARASPTPERATRGRRARASARPDHAQGRRRRQLHPRARAAGDHATSRSTSRWTCSRARSARRRRPRPWSERPVRFGSKLDLIAKDR